MIGAGGALLSVGIVIDAIRRGGSDNGAAMFDLTRVPSVLIFAGICVAVLGGLLMLLGRPLYADGPASGGRRAAQIGAPIVALLLVAGCAGAANSSDSASGAKSGGDAAEHDMGDMDHDMGDMSEHDMGSMDGHDHGSGAADTAGAVEPGMVIPGTATGDSPCEIALPNPASPGQVGTGEGGSKEEGGHGHRGMVAQHSLTNAERKQIVEQMRQARTVVDQYPTVRDAEAAGYKESTVYVPCIGAHYTNVARAGGFDPAVPSELLYDGTEPDSKIVGLSYLVWHPGGAPEGFAGANDIWHQHNSNGGLCLKGVEVLGGEGMTEADCTKAGGTKRILEDIWMMHAWVAPGWECSWGVFSGECPELGGRLGGSVWDEPTPDDDNAAISA